MECRCAEVTYLYGDEAEKYAAHLENNREQAGQWLVRCPNTCIEFVKDVPVDPAAREWEERGGFAGFRWPRLTERKAEIGPRLWTSLWAVSGVDSWGRRGLAGAQPVR